ncbi:MAG: bacillithiol system redox-active protein YtxJ [Ekhidna sp.]|uniref:bacillithiol system redox-active protein YtxJ n=1 Tax=Ekhidna sp. TaxID=2608089 RepID=UPI0032EF5B34
MLSNLFSKKDAISFPWKELISAEQLNELDSASKEKPVVIFKHSTRCSISAMTLNRFERSDIGDLAFEPYFLDLIAHRDVSNLVAERYGVKHESPQAILIRGGKAKYDASHMGISYDELNSEAEKFRE